METIELRRAVETLLFIADSPVPLARLCQIIGEADSEKVSGVVGELKREYDEQGRAIQVVEIAEGFQMATRVEGAPFVRKLYSEKMTMRLSTAALETLSIVAYRQPITRAEIEEVRGVEVIAALESLLDKRLCKVVGRKETVGRPLLYGTTPEFLRHFGLRSIEDLPPLDTFKPEQPLNEPGGSAENVLGAMGAAALAEPSPLDIPLGEAATETAPEATVTSVETVVETTEIPAEAVIQSTEASAEPVADQGESAPKAASELAAEDDRDAHEESPVSEESAPPEEPAAESN